MTAHVVDGDKNASDLRLPSPPLSKPRRLNRETTRHTTVHEHYDHSDIGRGIALCPSIGILTDLLRDLLASLLDSCLLLTSDNAYAHFEGKSFKH